MYLLQIVHIPSGAVYHRATFPTRQKAQEIAFSFLLHVSEIYSEDLDYTESMYETVAEHCYENDIVSIQITTINLPQE